MDESFVRQRRNLLLISIAVFLISYAGIEISNEVVLLGVKFEIKNPIVIYITIWIMFFYFFIRYIQYFIDLDSEDKDYDFPSHAWGSSSEYTSCNFRGRLSITLIFIKENIIGLLSFIISTIINKKISETLLPIIFSAIIMYISLQSEFTKSNYADVNAFKEVIYKEILDGLRLDYNLKNEKIDIK